MRRRCVSPGAKKNRNFIAVIFRISRRTHGNQSARKVRETRPQRMVEEAISGMLPKNKLGKQMYRKLQVYAGPKHPHDAQKPVALAV